MLDPLLYQLADGHFHSGDEIGEALGISRAAVWKRLKKLESLGLAVTSVKGRGYCIEGGLDLLDAAVVESMLVPSVVPLIADMEFFGAIPSTNQLAMEKAVTGGHGYVCTAEQQTAGRGRRGRSWVSPFAANIYMSIVWEFRGGASALEGLSLAVGVAVVNALKTLGIEGLQLKWPNDVVTEAGKLAGVLLEMVGDASGPCRVVTGIGLNVAMPRVSGATIDQLWTDIDSISSRQVSRNELLAALINEVVQLLAEFEGRGFSDYQDRWIALDAYAGSDVFVHLGDSVEFGRAAGVDRSGALVVDTAFGQKTYNGGEVSLRRSPQ